MDLSLKTIDANGVEISVDVVGFFQVPDLNKEYIMYSITDNNPDVEMGSIIIGEVIKNEEEGTMQILDIREDEQDLVVAFYNEISTQIGDE